MNTTHSLEYFVQSPVLRLIISIFFPLGILSVSNALSKYKLKNYNKELVSTYFYFLFISVLATLCYWFSTYIIVPVLPIKIVGYFFTVTGIIYSIKEIISFNFKSVLASISNMPKTLKFDVLLILIILSSWFLISLGPVTDADSLNYHIGFPLHILNTGKHVFTPLWNTALLTGTGEFLNLIGIVLGTDSLSASIQALAFILVSHAIYKSFSKIDKSIFSIKLLLIPFLLLFLITSQKNQIFGVLALTLSFFLYTKRLPIFMTLSLLFFSFSLKYSFYIPGGIFGLILLFESKTKFKFIALSVACYVFYLFPIHLFGILNYGTPIPPFLSTLVANKELSNIFYNFSIFLKSYIDGFPFPINLVLPRNIGSVTTTMGIAPFVFFLVNYKKDFIKNRKLLMHLSIILIGSLIFAQKNARFFLTIYFMFIVSMESFSLYPKIKKYFNYITSLQLFGMLLISSFALYSIFPGALNNDLRKKVLSKNAFQYNPASWVNTALPKNSFILSEFRTLSFFDHDFIANDYVSTLRSNPNYFLKVMKEKYKKHHNQEWFYISEGILEEAHIMYPYLDPSLYKKNSFIYTARNPFNKGRKKFTYIYRVKKELFK